jgi:hypothetical protein
MQQFDQAARLIMQALGLSPVVAVHVSPAHRAT